LVGNSLKCTKQGRISIQASPLPPAKETDDLRVMFSVADTGEGIPEDKLQLMFEPYEQADNSFSRQYQGAGLGLSIVRRLVKLMRGNISIESAPGEGTTVHVVLPFTLPAGCSERQQEEPPGLRGGQSLRILVAEDHPSNQLFIQKLLEREGHQVSLAKDGGQVLDLLGGQEFDCVLMDVQMPIMDGLEATRRIRTCDAEFKDVPVIALTAHAMSGDREKFLEAGMDDYLPKPVEKKKLLAALEKNVPG
ncbi:MAG: response regulator, partial [Desulfonatronovibrionaceae bacterium]